MTGEAPERLRVDLGQRGYDILVGAGLLQAAASHIKAFAKRPRLFVVTDEVVAGFHLKTLQGSLEAGGFQVHALILPAGEATKSFAQLSQLCSQLLVKGMERSDLLIALGGGVIGDLTGFAAAILLRGIDFVQIPTTLLAQVDSSVGGKTAIDVPEGKNLVGAFHQPRLVLADGDVLGTLPKRELLAGYAEVVKYGLIDKPDFFAWLEKNGEKLVAGDSALRRQAVITSCRAKAEIVARDETESGDRALLNLGHTFGHALETLLGYDEQLKHGEAVAIGLCQAFRFSHRLGLLGKEEAERVERHIAGVGLKTRVRQIAGFAPTPSALLAAMARDKKVKDGRVTFILARGIGRAFIERGIEPAVLEGFLASECV